MEFEIDFDLVNDITAREYEQARAEIAELGAVVALHRSLQRQDTRLENATDAPTLACRAGCSWCCYFSVDVRAVEVFSILEFMRRELSAAEQTRIEQEINTNSAVLNALSDLERVQKNIKCPFLSAGRCTIYAARPQTCRNYHATDARGCEQSFNEPGNLEIDPDFAPLVYQSGGAHVDAFAKAMRDGGYDVKAYELNTALAAALQDPNEARRRFDSKQLPFTDVDGAHIPLEWMHDELDDDE
jgi:Fe-S-cluster containining protein